MRDELCLAANMPEATEPRRSGQPTLGSEEANGSMKAPEASTKSMTAEQSKMTNPLKARKRTKTGCLSKFAFVRGLWEFSPQLLIHHSMPQATHQVR